MSWAIGTSGNIVDLNYRTSSAMAVRLWATELCPDPIISRHREDGPLAGCKLDAASRDVTTSERKQIQPETTTIKMCYCEPWISYSANA